MTPPRPLPIAASLLALALAAPLAAAPDDLQQDAGPVLGESVRVEVVNVDVTVTTRDGEPVAGLGPNDFEVYEDGQPVAITNFLAYSAPPSPPPAAAAAGGDAATSEPAAAVAGPADEERLLHLVIWIDNHHLHPLHRNRVLTRLRAFLRDQAPEARVMLVTAERSARVVEPFTDDEERVIRALLDVERATGGALAAASERNEMLRLMEEADDAAEVVPRLRQYVRSLATDLTFSLRALKSFVEPFAGLPGRKAMIHVSDGIPANPGEDLFWAVQEKFPEASVLHESEPFDTSRTLEELAATASANRVAFYTLDAAGLRAHAASAADRRQSAMDRLTPTLDALWVSNLQAPLRLLAERTGGLAVVNTNDVGPALARIGRELASGYSLGFAATHGGDGRYHTIEVKVRRDGVVVRHRDGYRDRGPADRMADATSAALLFGRSEERLGIGLDAIAERPREDGNRTVTLAIKIPFASMVLVPRGALHQGRLRLFVRVMDSDGGLSALEQRAVPIELPSEYLEAALRDELTYELELLMRPGPHQVAVAVWDELGGEGSTITRQLIVGGAN